MSIPVKEGNLVNVIETLRKEMIRTGIEEGLASQKTIALSQLLDLYIMKYQQLNSKRYNKAFH
ncbi:aspartyl-phosphate phosphatase Spo0E family protein [Robertmurraya yapensis]|uniref:Aspartyl-phosphate phosphatase Spo0E family protein n=2 Tax=Bacillaceae TaxID=186817 RepID=A0A3S0IMX7_9BACI|nr:aspartyl-phosphate phosphatase Spo0E family protein [Bacillus yapensis]RTR36001.1 aspartyl-phosphate phosphatase Spo0E family protein [Bacillus yapensis]TKT05504.1 Spo0E family sporulation regulatory protein-aspartic acid phosphatase [Bacillus yapensis]